MSFVKVANLSCTGFDSVRRFTKFLVNAFAVFYFFVGILIVSSSNLSAATLTVTKVADTNDNVCDADCSLREAVFVANTVAGSDDIVFGPLFATSQTITLTGEIVISSADPVTITGTAANLLTIAGDLIQRVFSNSGANTSIIGLTITNGGGTGATNSGFGGGVYNSGTLTLDRVRITGNQSTGGANGGGLYNNLGATMTITASTIDNNVGGSGGGAILNRSILTIQNSTISGNSAPNSGGGGGIVNVGTVSANSITVASNSTPFSGGGVLNAAGTFNSQNSIYADNTASSNPDFSGAFTSSGHNLIENIAGTTLTAFTKDPSSKNLLKTKRQSGFAPNCPGNDICGMDPMLVPLAVYFGSMPTQPPQYGGPAIDQGNSALTTDQISNTRPVDLPSVPNAAGGNGADVGAVERLAPTAAMVSLGGRVKTSSGQGIFRATVSAVLSNGDVRTTQTNNFGFFRFENIEVGQTVVFSIFSKQYQFVSRAENILEEKVNIDFVALEE